MNYWIALAILGLILTFLALIIFWFRNIEPVFRDTGTLRQALAKWEPLVLERDKTLRGVKRFANRARFLMAGEELDEAIFEKLVGFVALEEVGGFDSSVNEFDFEQWKQGE